MTHHSSGFCLQSWGNTPPQPSPGLLQLGIQDGQAITSGARGAAGSCRALARAELLVLLRLCDPWQRLPVGSEDLPLHLNHAPLRSPCRPSHCPAAVPEGPPLSPLPGHGLSPRPLLHLCSLSFLQEDLIEHLTFADGQSRQPSKSRRKEGQPPRQELGREGSLHPWEDIQAFSLRQVPGLAVLGLKPPPVSYFSVFHPTPSTFSLFSLHTYTIPPH